MKYIVIILVFILNYIVWKYFLFKIIKKFVILNKNRYTSIIVGTIPLLIVPYGLSLITLGMIGLDENIFNNPTALFALLCVYLVSYKIITKDEK